MARNLRNNPKLALTIDITHPINPFWNRGISIKSYSQLDESEEVIQACVSHLQKKYGLSTVTKILGIDTIEDFLRVKTTPIKIIYWKGPYFKRFNCKSQL